MKRVLSDIELENTKRKLSEMERCYADLVARVAEDEELRGMARRSLMRLINQMREEIAWTQSHQPVR